MRRVWAATLLLVLFVASANFGFPAFSAENGNIWVEVDLENVYGVRGESIGITASSNAPQVNVQILDPDGVKIYDKIWLANETRSIPIGFEAKYGAYTIRGVAGEGEAETWFTVLDISSWSAVTFPYVVTHNNIEYTFNGDWTVEARLYDDYLEVDFSTLRNLASLYGLDVQSLRNDMNFLARFSKGDIKVDLCFAFIHSGAKIIINGTLDHARDISINFDARRIKRWMTGLRSGHIVFDWSDILGGEWWTYLSESKELMIHAPQTFRIDPAIFEDGFESGDFSAWTGTSTDFEDTINVVSSEQHCGTYGCEANTSAGWHRAMAYKDFTGQQTVYGRLYFMLPALPSSGNHLAVLCLQGSDQGNDREIYGVYNDEGTYMWFVRTISNGYDIYYYSSGVSISVNTWYRLEVGRYIHGTEGWIRLWGDDSAEGSPDIEQTGLDSDDKGNVTRVRAGLASFGQSGTAYVDCVVVDDAYIGSEAGGEIYSRLASQALSWSGSALRTWSLTRTGTQTMQLSTQTSRTWTLTRTLTQSFSFDLSALVKLSEMIKRSATLAVQLSSDVLRTWTLTRTVSQGMTFTWNALGEWFEGEQWRILSILVTTLKGDPIELAIANVWRVNGSLTFSKPTNTSGYIPSQNISAGQYCVIITKEKYLPYNENFNLTRSELKAISLMSVEEAEMIVFNIPLLLLGTVALILTGLFLERGLNPAWGTVSTFLWFMVAMATLYENPAGNWIIARVFAIFGIVLAVLTVVGAIKWLNPEDRYWGEW